MKCTHCGDPVLRSRERVAANTNPDVLVLKRVWINEDGHGRRHACATPDRVDTSAREFRRANHPAKKENDRFLVNQEVSRADRRRQYNKMRKAAKRA